MTTPRKPRTPQGPRFDSFCRWEPVIDGALLTALEAFGEKQIALMVADGGQNADVLRQKFEAQRRPLVDVVKLIAELQKPEYRKPKNKKLKSLRPKKEKPKNEEVSNAIWRWLAVPSPALGAQLDDLEHMALLAPELHSFAAAIGPQVEAYAPLVDTDELRRLAGAVAAMVRELRRLAAPKLRARLRRDGRPPTTRARKDLEKALRVVAKGALLKPRAAGTWAATVADAVEIARPALLALSPNEKPRKVSPR